MTRIYEHMFSGNEKPEYLDSILERFYGDSVRCQRCDDGSFRFTYRSEKPSPLSKNLLKAGWTYQISWSPDCAKPNPVSCEYKYGTTEHINVQLGARKVTVTIDAYVEDFSLDTFADDTDSTYRIIASDS